MFFSPIRGISPPLWAVGSCPPREAALPPAGQYVNAHYKLMQPCHLPDSIASVSVYSPATCQTIALVSVYNADTCQTLLHRFHLTAVPLARLYCMVVSLQPCHWPDLIALVAVYSPATCQTLLQWFQFTAVLLVILYFIVFSWQS